MRPICSSLSVPSSGSTEALTYGLRRTGTDRAVLFFVRFISELGLNESGIDQKCEPLLPLCRGFRTLTQGYSRDGDVAKR
jgi:hypothetical protein